MQLSRIGLVVHPHRRLDGALQTLRAWGAEVGAEIVQIAMPGQDREVAVAGEAASTDLVVALGGDGTTLAALRAAARVGKPVLGVACGSLGALTATTAEELDGALRAVSAGRWHARRLPGVAVKAEEAEHDVALNDLVIIRKGASQIAIEVRLDGELYGRFAGDGLVVATPLGSSAYTMATGGPILAPGADSMVVTPVAPHGGCIPPLVAGADSVVTVEVVPGHAGARVELDGQIRPIPSRRMEIRWRAAHATLVAFDGAESMLAGLRRRHIIMDSPRLLARDDRAEATTRR